MSAINDKIIDLTETYEYRTTKDLTCKKEEFKCNNITKQYNNQLYNIAIVN